MLNPKWMYLYKCGCFLMLLDYFVYESFFDFSLLTYIVLKFSNVDEKLVAALCTQIPGGKGPRRYFLSNFGYICFS